MPVRRFTDTQSQRPSVLPHNESRIVDAFVIPCGSVDLNAYPLLPSEYVPVKDFAAFYVTGTDEVRCSSDSTTQTAQVVGHFIKYIGTPGGPGSGGCVLSSLGTCVAVFTK
jgi:hypothetical protein